MDLRYLGKSELREAGGAFALAFAPNLARPRVFFDAEVRDPVRFREAMGALHDVVIGDLRAQKKDRSAWRAWKEEQIREEAALRRQVFESRKREELDKLGRSPIPHDLEESFRRMHDLYWRARRQWASELSRNDPELFRHLVPCDPVVTVAPDCVFFECFAKDESSYGCLSVSREAFRGGGEAGLGTTNVDYSLGLYEHFQTLRSYRPTRLLVDPKGFEVATGSARVREEKIDLPGSWLRGFGQIQAAMALPARRVVLPPGAVYSALAWLDRHREKSSPRCIRFLLEPGKPPRMVLEPWGKEIEAQGGAPYAGERAEEIRVWGRRRLFALARLLPLADRFEVRLLGTGLPSIWVAHLPEMRFTLALSGWTASDWSAGTNLDLLSSDRTVDPGETRRVAFHLEQNQQSALDPLATALQLPRERTLAALHELSRRGQVIYDFAVDRYRWRQVMPMALSDDVLGAESPELVEGRKLAVRVEREEPLDRGRKLFVAKVGETSCEAILDADGALSKARCTCSFFHKTRMRTGPCRHLIALRIHAKRPN